MVQSWVEMLGMPYREIEAKFRRSEMVMMGWQSGERASQMHARSKRNSALMEPGVQPPPQQPQAVPPELCDENGHPDISKMTTNQAMRFMRNLGFAVAMPPPMPAGGK
ncbi:MAG: hypothetical protein KGL39_13625 [Patescibacteria group bacterium]|nr:hypothetical protein [Patescibacteria group bacterium]